MAETSTNPHRVLTNVEELIGKFESGWTYPHRPLLCHAGYHYKLLHVVDPDEFSLTVDDGVSKEIEEGIDKAMEEYRVTQKDIRYDVQALDINDLKELLPVAVLTPNDGKFYRGEVNATDLKNGKVNVTFVDTGIEDWVSATCVFPPSIAMLQYPRLALMCLLSQVIPYKDKNEWKDKDWGTIFKGKKSNQFRITAVHKGLYHVHLKCDNVDIAYDLMTRNVLADPVPLGFVEPVPNVPEIGKYPKSDFSEWIGLKISVFGVSAIKLKSQVKVYLQMDLNLADAVLKETEAVTPSESRNFPKNVGDPVLINYEGIRYRGTITQVGKNNSFMIKLVDYGDVVLVSLEDLMEIPADLLKYPELATSCYVIEAMNVPFTEKWLAKLRDAIQEKNLNCMILCANFIEPSDALDPRKCLVSLMNQTDDPKRDIPFVEALEECEAINLQLCYPLRYPDISQSLAGILLSNNNLGFLPEKKYEGILACVDSSDSIWLQLEGDSVRAEVLTQELTDYYKFCDCPALESSLVIPGTYVGAQQNDESDKQWYRAKILDGADSGKCQVLFIDYGNADNIEVSQMKPLPAYFARSRPFATEVALPIDVKPEAEDAVFDLIFEKMEGAQLSVYLQQEGKKTYGWIYVSKDKSFPHYLVSKGLGSLKFQPTSGIPSF